MSHDFRIGPTDTDSISFCKKDGSPFTEEEQEALIKEINDFLPERIVMEPDGYFEKIICLKAKNYILYDGKKIKTKGSGIRDRKKEPALREMIERVIKSLVFDGEKLEDIYKEYVKEACHIQDIQRWCVKKSVTRSVLEPTRTTEQKILDAIKHLNPQLGDKYFLYNAIDGEVQSVAKGLPVFSKKGEPKMIPNRILKLGEKWDGSDEEYMHYVERVFDNISIFENVIDINLFTRYSLTKNFSQLCALNSEEK